MSTEESEKKNKRKAIVDALLNEQVTKGSAKGTTIESLKSIAVAGLGIALGSALGRPSLIAGVATTASGYYLGVPKLTQLGVGLMVCGGFQLSDKGLKGFDGIKERLKTAKDNVKHNLYLDKIFKSKEDKGTNGFGEVQFFNPENSGLTAGNINNLEQEIERNSHYFGEQPGAERTERTDGTEGLDDISGIADRLY